MRGRLARIHASAVGPKKGPTLAVAVRLVRADGVNRLAIVQGHCCVLLLGT